MGIINTGNFISFGNDSHCEFLLTSYSDDNVPINRNVDLSHNRFRIIYWDLSHFSNVGHYKLFDPYSISSIGWSVGWSNPTNYTVSEYDLSSENFAVDFWFAKADRNLITSDSNDYFYFLAMADGYAKSITGFTFGISHQSSTNFQLDFICSFPNAAGYYNLTYNLGAYSTFPANTFHHAAAVKHNNFLIVLYDGVVVAATDTSTIKRFNFSNHRLDFFIQSDTSQEYYIDELRYSKNIKRFWSTTTGKKWAIPNRSYSSKYRLFNESKIRAGYGYNISLDKNSNIWQWGANSLGQLGTGDKDKRSTPNIISNFPIICEIDVGGSADQGASVCIDSGGKVWTWGFNGTGQLGDNSTADKCVPVSLLGTNKTFCKIVAGYWHTMAIRASQTAGLGGRVWAWGSNSNGELGDYSATSRLTPVAITGATRTFCQIGAGVFFSHGLTNGGLCWTWGKNTYGQLGDNSVTDRCTPVSIYKITSRTFCKIDGGEFHTISIDKNGRVWGWGYNNNGQLGNNATISKRTPVTISGATKTFCHISAGYLHTVGLDKNGLAWCWGLNSYGQLGINNTTNTSTPKSVLGNKKTFCAISAGKYHTVAVDCHGYVWAWGRNDDYSELGMPDVTTSTNTPMMIVY